MYIYTVLLVLCIKQKYFRNLQHDVIISYEREKQKEKKAQQFD